MNMTTLPASFNLAAYVLGKAQVTPDKVALEVAGQSEMTYCALSDTVRKVATGLLRQGLKPQDRVLMRMGNTQDFPIVYLAAIAVGLVPIPASSQLTTPEVTRICEETKPLLIVADDGVSIPDDAPAVLPSSALRGFEDCELADFQMGDPHRPAYIIYTSGTAGKPRAVVHAHRAIWARRAMFRDWYDINADDRVMHAGAFNWSYTLGTGLMDPWTVGATAIVAPDGTHIEALPQLLESSKATIFAAAPGVYRKILKHALPRLPFLRHGLSAGEKLPDVTAQAWSQATGTPLCEAFGASECSTFISYAPRHGQNMRGIGFVQSGRSVGIRHEERSVTGCDVGEISISQDEIGLMLGYLEADGDIVLPLKNGWFGTGDLANRGPNGDIIYQGRKDDMMNAGGFRVSPLEVEAALAMCDGVQDVACCELPVKKDASVIAAFYTASNVLDEKMLAAQAADTLAPYKRPRMYIHRESLPRGANNKLKRRELRQEWIKQNGQT